MMKILLFFIFSVSALVVYGAEKTIVRVGHFPNVTHAQGVIGHGLTRQGKGWFEKFLGPDVEVQWFVYGAGPTAMEGIFVDTIDLTYVGPGPTINAYLRSDGEEVRIVSGACSGGAALVVQGNGQIQRNSDFKGKRIATPKLGNTQDIAARFWLKSQGFQVSLTGGDVLVIPTDNADQLSLFRNQDVVGVWTVEPWVSRLVLEGGGKVYLEESSLWPQTQGRYVTTHLVSSQKFIKDHPDLLKKWVRAHVELTAWINQHPDEAKELFREEVKEEIKFTLPLAVLERAWHSLSFTHDPISFSLYKYGEQAYDVGLLKKQPDLTGIYQLQWLEEILAERGRTRRDGR